MTNKLSAIIKYGMVLALLYAIYKLFEYYPVPTLIATGSITIFIIIYWLIDLENDTT